MYMPEDIPTVTVKGPVNCVWKGCRMPLDEGLVYRFDGDGMAHQGQVCATEYATLLCLSAEREIVPELVNLKYEQPTDGSPV